MARVGDVVEIQTANGMAYAHYTHKNAQYGALLRVFSEVYEQRPLDLVAAVAGEPAFNCFFPLTAAVRRGIVAIVGRAIISEDAARFPLFRAGLPDRDGKVKTWWLWDGEREWRVGKLTPAQRKLSIRGTINDTLLIDRIESRWSPEFGPR